MIPQSVSSYHKSRKSFMNIFSRRQDEWEKSEQSQYRESIRRDIA